MDIAAYQRWFAEYDRARGLDLVEPSQVTVHLMEEVGEIAREVLYLEGYRNPSTRQDGIARLSAELGDALVFLTKLAVHYGLDLDTIARDVISKAETRWPIEEAHREMERYIQHRQSECAERAQQWQQRTQLAKNTSHSEESSHA